MVLIRLDDTHLTNTALKNLDGANRIVNDVLKGWFAGTAIQMSQMENMSYDKDRHVIWSILNSASVLGEIIRSLTIDPDVAITPPVPLSQLMGIDVEQANAKYRDLVARIKGGFLGRFSCSAYGMRQVQHL